MTSESNVARSADADNHHTSADDKPWLKRLSARDRAWVRSLPENGRAHFAALMDAVARRKPGQPSADLDADRAWRRGLSEDDRNRVIRLTSAESRRASAAKWVARNLTRAMLDHIIALENEGLIKPTSLFYDTVLPPDAFQRRETEVLIYPHGGSWHVLEYYENGGGGLSSVTKAEAIDFALDLVQSRNAELRLTNQTPLDDAEWKAMHDAS